MKKSIFIIALLILTIALRFGLADPSASVSIDDIVDYVEKINGFKPRFTGYEGCREAARYIFNEFSKYLDNVTWETYPILIPYDAGSTLIIKVGGEEYSFKVYPFLPNDVQTCYGEYEGKLVYVGDASYTSLNGKELNGSIAVVELDCYISWVRLIDFGVKAVVFIPKYDVNRLQMEGKYLDIPVKFPRALLSLNDRERIIRLLRENMELEAKLKIGMKWEVKSCDVIYGYINGASKPDEVVVLLSHFDSYSWAPSLPTGASDAIGISILMELARVFSVNRPERSILFVAVSGHYQGLYGTRMFIERHILNESDRLNLLASNKKIFVIDLKVFDDDSRVSFLYVSYFYDASTGGISVSARQRYVEVAKGIDKVLDYLSSNMPEGLDEEYISHEYEMLSISQGTNDWQRLFPRPIHIDAEAFFRVGLASVCFHTAYSFRKYLGTELDTPERINWENVLKQAVFIESVVNTIVNDVKYGFFENLVSGLATTGPKRSGSYGESFGDFVGKIVTWDPDKANWVPLSEAGLKPAIVSIRLGGATFSGSQWNVRFYLLTDKDGVFTLNGSLIGWGASYEVRAYIMDENYNIIYVSDFGRHGGEVWSNTFLLNAPIVGSKDNPRLFVVFKASGIVLPKILDPLVVSEPLSQSNNLYPDGAYENSFSIEVLEEDTGVPPDAYSWYMDPKGIGVVFLQPNSKALVVMRTKGREYPIGFIIVNSGDAGTEAIYTRFLERISLSVMKLALERRNRLKSFGVTNYMLEKFISMASEKEAKLQALIEDKRYDEYFVESVDLLGLAYNSYAFSRGLYMDVILSTVLLFILILVFSILLEKTLTGDKSAKIRAFSLISIFTVTLVTLSILHPGFTLAANIIMVEIGFVMLLFIGLILFILFLEFTVFLQTYRRERLGVHFMESRGIEVGVLAMSTGTEYMKRRKIRTLLTLISITVIAFALVTFTSGQTMIVITPKVFEPELKKTLYNGILLERIATVNNPLSIELYEYLKIKLKNIGLATIKIWSLQPRGAAGQQFIIHAVDPATLRKMDIRGIYGLMPEEYELVAKNITLIEGKWFDETDVFVCIIPESLHELFELNVGDEILIQGLKLRIIGIFSDTLLANLREIDNRELTPIIGSQGGLPIHSRPSYTIIVPVKLVIYQPWLTQGVGVDFQVAQITARVEADKERLMDIAEEIALTHPGFDIFIGYGDKIYHLSKRAALQVAGLEYMIIPIIISVLNIVTMVLAAVYERMREIFVYSALGLAPVHVGLMFLAEFSVYAIFGSLVGYTIAVAFLRAFSGMVGIYPNYISAYVMMTIGISVLSVLVATLYPMFKITRIALPSLKRRWELPTKPAGDIWNIPLPFFASSREEAIGVLWYLAEFAAMHRSEEFGKFVATNISGAISEDEMELKFRARIAPWRAGIEQDVAIKAMYFKERNNWTFNLVLKRISGDYRTWRSANYVFVDTVRKQFLLWRSQPPEKKKEYFEKGLKRFSGG